MLAVYRILLYLYPSAYRREYGEEIMAVLYEVQIDTRQKGPASRALACARELSGLLRGALREQAYSAFRPCSNPAFLSRRVPMRSEFRFPKSTLSLMLLILFGVVMAIDKARDIAFSVPYANPPIGPIHPAQGTAFTSLALLLLAACLAGAVGWVVVFAFHRSGLQRFAEIDPSKEKVRG